MDVSAIEVKYYYYYYTVLDHVYTMARKAAYCHLITYIN